MTVRRRTAAGKVVWCEQITPGIDPDPIDLDSRWPDESTTASDRRRARASR